MTAMTGEGVVRNDAYIVYAIQCGQESLAVMDSDRV